MNDVTMTVTIPEHQWRPGHPTLNGQALRETGARLWIETTLEEERRSLTVFTAETRGMRKGRRWFPLTVTSAHVQDGDLIIAGTVPGEFCDLLPPSFDAQTFTWLGEHTATVTIDN